MCLPTDSVAHYTKNILHLWTACCRGDNVPAQWPMMPSLLSPELNNALCSTYVKTQTQCRVVVYMTELIFAHRQQTTVLTTNKQSHWNTNSSRFILKFSNRPECMKHNDNQQYVNLILSSVTPMLQAAHVIFFYMPIIMIVHILSKQLFPQIKVYWHTYGTAVHIST